MSLTTIVVDVEKGIEIGAEDFAKVFTKFSTAEPKVIAALGVLAEGIENALAASAIAAADPGNLGITVPATAKDFAVLWPDLKAFLGTLGIKIK